MEALIAEGGAPVEVPKARAVLKALRALRAFESERKIGGHHLDRPLKEPIKRALAKI